MGLWSRLARFVTGNDPAARAEVERVLLEADFGVAATDEILGRLGKSGTRDPEALEAAVVELLGPPATPLARADRPPTVIVICGVNGTGKTTTVAKLASRLTREGRSVLLAAADTFRAGANAQLKIWADRLNAAFVGGAGEPAAVAFDAVQAAAARGIDTVFVDTAGRLHTDERLIEELKKIVRVLAKHHPGAPHETLLVVDATTGQNGLQQARLFGQAVEVSGIALTKLDGSAKGGIAIAIAHELGLPVKLIGIGESLDDLRPFDPEDFARALVGEA